MRKKILLGALLFVVAGGLVAYRLAGPPPADTRYSGAYALDDGTLVFLAPREDKGLRYRLMNGESGVFWPISAIEYEGGAGWAEREPVVNRVRFEADANGRARGFTWEHVGEQAGGASRHARRLDLSERIFTFASGELTLRGKLVLPAGDGAVPAVVLVHGSGSDSAVDYRFEPYLYAAHGFAGLVFDKRGTGESQGEYLQNFEVLAQDVLAAVRWLRGQPRIDPQSIHLAGFSQGGWVAPLAALQDGAIRSVLVGFGVMLPVTAEDRWGYVYELRQQGFGEEAIAAADRVNAVIGDILDRRLDRWDELGEMLETSREQPWFEAVKGSDSMLGIVAGKPLWAVRAFTWWMGIGRDSSDPPFIDRLYDPMPTMRGLQAPSLWLLAGDDSSAPTPWTVEKLRELQNAGQPVQYVVYPGTEHGIVRFEQGADGERRELGYDPGYFPRQIAWLRARSQ